MKRVNLEKFLGECDELHAEAVSHGIPWAHTVKLKDVEIAIRMIQEKRKK